MELKGRLGSLPLADVLRLIDSKHHAGRLRIQNGDRCSVLYLAGGNVEFSSALMDPVRVGQRLATLGQLPRRELLSWKLAVRRGQKHATAQFHPGPNVSAEAWRRAFAIELENESLELFGWEDGEFEFEAGQLDLDEPLRLGLPIEEYLTEATRKCERWREIRHRLPEGDVVPAIVDFTAEEFPVGGDVSELEWSVLAHVDGRRDLSAIASLASLSEFEAYQGAAGLVEKRYVQWTLRPPDSAPDEPPEETAKAASPGFFGRLAVRDKPGEDRPVLSPVSLVTQLENRLLDRMEEETGEEAFEAGPFLSRHWRDLCCRHPLLDWFPSPGRRLTSARFEREPALWEDPEACDEVILEGLDALRDLIDATYEEMLRRWGEKKALQLYRKEYEQVFQPEATAEMPPELGLLALAR